MTIHNKSPSSPSLCIPVLSDWVPVRLFFPFVFVRFSSVVVRDTIWWCRVGMDDSVSTFCSHSQHFMFGVILSSKDNNYKIIPSTSPLISSGVNCWLLYVIVYEYGYISTIRWYFSCCLFVVYVHIVCCIVLQLILYYCCWLLYMILLVHTMKP